MDAVKKNNAAVPVQPNPQCPSEPKTDRAHDQMLRTDGQAAACCNCNAGAPAAVLMIFLACILVGTAREVRDRPRDLAFLAFAYADLAALFLCLRRAERLPREPSPEEGAEERRRLQLVVWALSGALSCAFAYRVSLIMPPGLVVAVWSMTSSVVVVGFFVLVL
ncbi:hypothetical protein PAHAL_3G140500 [Panicum hallii]|jgi:hypothetical protein|uniref:Uncharacterized protein n=1 Tax=Panicum hallii TaxID=206008 RepID=A0A2S3H8M1_9POAL|nr:hypothetical protein PAHAL_3G140500 [Panicum hallii]